MNQHDSITLRRQRLGIELGVSLAALKYATDTTPILIDDVFACRLPAIKRVVADIAATRRDLKSRLDNGETIDIFVPQADPPQIRVLQRGTRHAYYSVGEICRPLLLREDQGYPFKPHQRSGVKWLENRRVGILADDMGLGKTLQTIAALETSYRHGTIRNALVLCPKSLIGVWEAELALWTRRLCVVALHTPISTKEWAIASVQSHVVITNYEAIRRQPPEPRSFDLVVFDEIHRLKNPASQNYRAAYDLQPTRAWGLSGTPLENRAADLVSVLHLLDPQRVSLSDKLLPTSSLRALASRYILRRNRQVIADELSDVTEKVELIPLAPEQRQAYRETLRSSTYDTVGAWISTFNKLRDICDYDPSTKTSAKIDRAVTIIDSVMRLNEKVVVFSWRIEPLRQLHRRVEDLFGKAAVQVITGRTPSTRRSHIVEKFQTDVTIRILLCSTRATAEGLTLTAANHVVFLNEWWNPATNYQARDRVNRIGQRRGIFVYRLRSRDTIESRLGEILERKSALFDDIINRLPASSTSGKSIPADLYHLFDSDHSNK